MCISVLCVDAGTGLPARTPTQETPTEASPPLNISTQAMGDGQGGTRMV